MLLDTVATLQGVVDTRKANEITQEQYVKIHRAIHGLSRLGDAGRIICNYAEFLCAIAGIEMHWTEATALWKRLGPSIASGLIVASDEETR